MEDEKDKLMDLNPVQQYFIIIIIYLPKVGTADSAVTKQHYKEIIGPDSEATLEML